MYQPVIGLEVHIELKTKSKMFCGCRNNPDAKTPNSEICPICLGHPGTLPVINEKAVKKVIKTGIALNCKVPEYSRFDRKNYFYPDLPKGYQISQYDAPLCKGGYLEIPIEKLKAQSLKLKATAQKLKLKKIRIRRVHLEEDTGRLVHEKDYSLVDFNRAGVPLMELVTEPDLGSAIETREFAQELQLILRYLDVSEADMEKGQLRVEVNISLLPHKSEILMTNDQSNPKGAHQGGGVVGGLESQIPNLKLGTKVEIKNLNSFRSVEKGIDYEIKRQTKILNSGKKVVQETRGWNEIKEVTVTQREKEEAQDYRYFPEPDLPPLHFTEKEIAKIKAEIPELPQARRERLAREYQLDEKSIEVFVFNKDLGEYFEKVVSEFDPRLPKEKLLKLIKLATNYLITDLQGLLKGLSVKSKDFLITPENFAEFITLIHQGRISSKIAKTVLEEMFKTGADPSHIIEEKGLIQITDEAEIERIIKEVISKNQKAVKDFKKGKEAVLQFLIGQVMSQTKGKANPQIVNKILKKQLQ